MERSHTQPTRELSAGSNGTSYTNAVHGGRPWASCPATESHVVATARHETSKSEERKAALILHGPPSFETNGVIRRIIANLWIDAFLRGM